MIRSGAVQNNRDRGRALQWNMQTTRRNVFSTAMKPALIAMVAACTFACVAAHARDELHLFNWNNYIAPATVSRFEALCKCRVVQAYYSDNEELLAKLAAGAKGYDVLVPTSNVLPALIKSDQLLPLDKSKLTNFKNIDPAYLDTPFDPTNRYSVPYAMSMTVIGYNHSEIARLALPTDSWAEIGRAHV